MKVDKKIIEKAASELLSDLGSLSDLPAELRNTIASLCYEYWWFRTTQNESTGHPDWVVHAATRMGQYEMVPTMVKLMRETRAKHSLGFEMMVGATRDFLRYNIQDVAGKSAARRSMEKLFRKPFHEVPGIYAILEKQIPALRARAPSPADVADSQGTRHREKSPGQPNVLFISQLPDPSESRRERVYKYRRYSVSYYRNPKSYGEVVARIPSLYNYPQVAVVDEGNEPVLIVRTEQGVGNRAFICSLSRDGSRRNLGEFESTDPEIFLQRVTGEVSRLDAHKEQPAGAG